MSFNVDQIDLSLADPSTGRYLTANVYYVDGVTDANNVPRQLSIGQLVMAICLQRASTLEAQIVQMMEDMNATSAKLEAMTEIETAMLDYEYNGTNGGQTFSHWRLSDNDYYGNAYFGTVLHDLKLVPDDVDWVYRAGNTPSSDPDRKYVTTTQLVTDIEAKMDEMNSFSQQKMIELQSLTNKRDQSYDMISNILKSLGTVMTGIVNNV